MLTQRCEQLARDLQRAAADGREADGERQSKLQESRNLHVQHHQQLEQWRTYVGSLAAAVASQITLPRDLLAALSSSDRDDAARAVQQLRDVLHGYVAETQRTAAELRQQLHAAAADAQQCVARDLVTLCPDVFAGRRPRFRMSESRKRVSNIL